MHFKARLTESGVNLVFGAAMRRTGAGMVKVIAFGKRPQRDLTGSAVGRPRTAVPAPTDDVGQCRPSVITGMTGRQIRVGGGGPRGKFQHGLDMADVAVHGLVPHTSLPNPNLPNARLVLVSEDKGRPHPFQFGEGLALGLAFSFAVTGRHGHSFRFRAMMRARCRNEGMTLALMCRSTRISSEPSTTS